MDNETQKQISSTILNQLGGYGKLKAFVNAKYLTYDETGSLKFQFSGSKKAKLVKISLSEMDTYNLTFYKISKMEPVIVEQIDGVYNDQLKSIFEETTGLYLSF